MNQRIIDSIIKKTGNPDLMDLLVNQLTIGELQSLLLKAFELKSRKKNCGDILKEFKSTRFVKPSDIDPILHRNLELEIFNLLPPEFEIIDLSPLTPLGTASVLASVPQNNVVSALRNLEVAADTTNILALVCAVRRAKLTARDPKSAGTIKLCSSQRVTRAQSFAGEYFSAHFSLLALCTAGRDEGNEKFETESLDEHISFYLRLIDSLIDKSKTKCLNIKLFEYSGFDNSGLIRHISDNFLQQEHIHLKTEKDSQFGRNYYQRLRFMISVVNSNNQEFDYIDGGFTNWTSRLLNNKKERLLTSGIGTDYMVRTKMIKDRFGTKK